VHGWLTRAYPSTSPAITALFSGLHTKVAIYAIYRIYAVMFDGDRSYLWIGLIILSATMAIGVMGAVGQDTTRSILVFHMISQIGYILLGVALFTLAGLTAGIFYLIHHMIVKASLFLSTGAIEHAYGDSRLERLGGIAKKEPWLAAAFIGAALSLAGLPPFSGFVAKLTLLAATVADQQWAVAAVVVAVSLITLMSMLKIWGAVFWGKPSGKQSRASGPAAAPRTSPATTGTGGGTATAVATAPTRPTERRVRTSVLLPSVVLTATTLCIGLGAEGLLTLSEQAAQNLLDTSSYVEAVTGP
jgi:multicomponent Na+:H+ antiporter subunit D